MSQQPILFEDQRDLLGKKVREVWIEWAKEQPNPKPSWLVPYIQLSEPDKEVDRRIGEALFRMGIDAATSGLPKPRRTCAACGHIMGRYHKWKIGPDGRIRHRICERPESYI